MAANLNRRLRNALLSISLLSITAICAHTQAAASKGEDSPSFQQMAALGVAKLQSWFDPKTGLYDTTGWWNSANAVTTLADYTRLTKDQQYVNVFPIVFSAAQRTSPGFLNNYYDDEGWWALAWIDAYDVTHEKRYLDMAGAIFADMTTGWDESCSGGIWWSKDRKYKNAIANELFLSVAAYLAARSNDDNSKSGYLDWARREWQWFSRTGMINPQNQINDGLDAKCVNNHKTTWTYNQGVILGALAELYGQTHDGKLLEQANAIARATLTNPALIGESGILHEPCEPNCGADGTQFKGIFVRNLARLYSDSPVTNYKTFSITNAESIWSGMKPPEYGIGLIWRPPYGEANASTQGSGVDALVATIAMGTH
ncbi:MAG TPA: glycoside hydrolase family 76 protein [Terracidiphilus sp.]|nr:glycoside hydrolase family 76 protein [Terracidiphilus sp.]